MNEIGLRMKADNTDRFLVVVLGAYKQMRSQSTDVLSDVGEDNFDKAFSFLRPGTLSLCIRVLVLADIA